MMDARTMIQELYEDIPLPSLVPTPLQASMASVKPDPTHSRPVVRSFIPFAFDPVSLVEAMVAVDTEDVSDAAREIEVEQQKEFLAAYIRMYNPTEAAVAAKIPVQRVSRWRKAPAFNKIYLQVQDMVLQSLEAEGVRRAYDGSDRLLIKFLEAYAPEKFGRTTRLTGSNPDGSLNINITSWAELARSAVVLTPQEKLDAVESDPEGEDGDGGDCEDYDDDDVQTVSVVVPVVLACDDLPPRVGVRGETAGRSAGAVGVYAVFDEKDTE